MAGLERFGEGLESVWKGFGKEDGGAWTCWHEVWWSCVTAEAVVSGSEGPTRCVNARFKSSFCTWGTWQSLEPMSVASSIRKGAGKDGKECKVTRARVRSGAVARIWKAAGEWELGARRQFCERAQSS